jgi:hypothetical protein
LTLLVAIDRQFGEPLVGSQRRAVVHGEHRSDAAKRQQPPLSLRRICA